MSEQLISSRSSSATTAVGPAKEERVSSDADDRKEKDKGELLSRNPLTNSARGFLEKVFEGKSKLHSERATRHEEV